MQRLRLGKITNEIQSIRRSIQDIEFQVMVTETEMSRLLRESSGSGQLIACYCEIDRLKGTQQSRIAAIQKLTILEEQERLTLAELQAHEQALEKLINSRRDRHRKDQLKSAQLEVDEIAIRNPSL